MGHPAPFPVELPRRLIELYTYIGDVVLDRFCGAAQTALACLRTRRHYVGFDIDPGYVALGARRISAEMAVSAPDVPGAPVPDAPRW